MKTYQLRVTETQLDLLNRSLICILNSTDPAYPLHNDLECEAVRDMRDASAIAQPEPVLNDWTSCKTQLYVVTFYDHDEMVPHVLGTYTTWDKAEERANKHFWQVKITDEPDVPFTRSATAHARWDYVDNVTNVSYTIQQVLLGE